MAWRALTFPGLRERDAQQKWAGSRPIWNQHTYSVSNVNDDGTIPPMDDVVSQWNSPAADPNSLRQNVQGKTGVSLALPDITVSGDPVVRCLKNQARATISLQLCNRGLVELPAGSAKVAVAAAVTPGRSLCARSNAAPLLSGTCETLSCDVDVPEASSGFDIAIVADSENAVPECTEGQANTSLISNVYCQRLPQ